MIPFGTNFKGNAVSAQSLTPAIRKVTAAGTAVSCKAGNEVAVVINLGTWTDGTHVFTVWEAPDVAGAPGTFAQTAAANLDTYNDAQLDVNGALNVTDNTQAGASIVITYIGAAPWLKVQQACSGSPATGLASQASVVVSNLRYVGNNPGGNSGAW